MKDTFLDLCTLFTFFQSHGQFISSFGINSGFSNSYLIWEQQAYDQPTREITTDNLVSVNISAYIEFYKKKHWSLQFAVGYLEKGEGDPLNNAMNSTNLSFISTSITANGNLNLGRFEPFIELGPRLDFRISGDEFLDGLYEQSQYSELREADYPNIYYGLNGGVGAKYNMNKLVVGIKYQKVFTFNKLIEYKENDTSPYYLSLDDETWLLNLILGFTIS